ncbi:MAG: M1 family metallopeptidase, partial [Candidatus Eremiobacteraeota bacterium]|nr:M1 family metallopeptidase [Candidatus Eremiobacteraeota bacterium]
MRRPTLATLLALAPLVASRAQQSAAPAPPDSTRRYTHADTLRGTVGPARAWWDVRRYDLHVRFSPVDSSITGWNAITYRVVARPRTSAGARTARGELQLDLQIPLVLDSVLAGDGTRPERARETRPLAVRRDSNAYFVTPAVSQPIGARRVLTAYYHGRPRVATHAPWDGGVVWTADSLGHPWFATAVQGLGASAWWPVKDTQADEPDAGQTIAITVPDSMQDVSNGRLRSTVPNGDGTTTYTWAVTNPINNYDVTANAGHYAHFTDTYNGEDGRLTLDFWPLAYHLDTARVQFQQVKPMLACFEHWFGPYPWYADGYKLIETPHLGMEHQSAVAYGNHYRNGYLGRDLSRTGLGLGWDFIIVHESGHEWWGNSLTSRDIADMWVHEGFTSYAEALYVECREGRAAGARYVIGTRARILNDRPIVGPYGVNAEGSSDMYFKGASMLHTIRQLVGDDARWRATLRGLQQHFRHQVVTGAEVEQYMSHRLGMDLAPVFAEYLTTTQVPTLEYRYVGRDSLAFHWTNVVPGFAMPVRIVLPPDDSLMLHPRPEWQRVALPAAAAPARSDTLPAAALHIGENYYAVTRNADAPAPAAAAATPSVGA